MTTYIALFNLTDAGIKAAKDSPRRLDAAEMENGARGKFFWRTATPPTMLVRGAGGWFATSRPQN
jgi:hypothetical protein